MQVSVTNQPYILYETIELLRAYVNGISPNELTLNKEFCLTPQEIVVLMASACEGLDPTDKWVRHFFQDYQILDDSNQKTCLASCIAYSSFNVSMCETTLDQQLAFVVNRWEQLRHNGYRVNSIDSFGIELDTASVEMPVRLADELQKLPIPSDFYLLLHETFSDLAFSAGQLARTIRPVAERLAGLLQPYVQRAEALMEQWLRFPQDRNTLRSFLCHCGIVVDVTFDHLHLVLRYLGARYAVGDYDKTCRTVGIHIGVGVEFNFTAPPKEKPRVRARESAAFKLLGDQGRQDIIRLLGGKAMTMRDVANQLEVNSGTVFRNINSLYHVGLLVREDRGGRLYYKAKLPYIQAIFDHIMEYLQSSHEPRG